MSFNGLAEQPLSKCLSGYPFRLIDSSCGSFDEVCVKKGDANCDNLKNSCKQCPPTNYTSFMLMNILNVVNNLQKYMDIYQQIFSQDRRDFNLSIKILTDQYESIRNLQKNIDINEGRRNFNLLIKNLTNQYELIKDLQKNIDINEDRRNFNLLIKNLTNQYELIKGFLITLLMIVIFLLAFIIDTRFKIINKFIPRLQRRTWTRRNNHQTQNLELSRIQSKPSNLLLDNFKFIQEINDRLTAIQSEIESIKRNSEIPETTRCSVRIPSSKSCDSSLAMLLVSEEMHRNDH